MIVSGGTLLDCDGERVADLRIGSDGRISDVGVALVADDAEVVHDASGCLVVPGGIDAHTHMHLPVGKIRVSDDFDTGTRAAAIGGTTTVIDYVTAYRGEDPLDALRTWQSWATPSVVDYGLHMTFTEPIDEATIAACVERGITSFKLYMAYPELLQVDDDTILSVMRAAKKHGGLITLHCESGGAIEVLRAQAIAAGHGGVLEHANTRPAQLEAEATKRAALLAERAECAAYIVHLSSAPALAAVREAQLRGVDIMAETCPQYLYLDISALRRDDGENFVCTPPLRDRWHAEELWEGMARGWIHTVATDHCPFWMHDRHAGTQNRVDGYADFREIPGGLPGIETRMALVWEGVAAGRITRGDWVRLCAEAPAHTFGLWPRKGNLRVGSDADVVIWDPLLAQSLDASALHMRVDHSPYEGRTSTGWPRATFVRGSLVATNKGFVGEPAYGQYLSRGTFVPT